MGQEGAGKTTLARQLHATFRAAGIPSRYLHVHGFLKHLVHTPWLAVQNRYLGKAILVFDRSIYDNIVVHTWRSGLKARIVGYLFTLISPLYPKHDIGFYLHCPLELIRERRLNTASYRYQAQQECYERISTKLAFVPLESTRPILRSVIGTLIQFGDKQIS
jgi:thymidylate kinase